jgi:TP901 family phage tail tape measure protein
MARAFNLTAEINLRGPSNIRTVVADIRRQLGSVDVNINPRINPASIRNITTMNTALRALNGTLSITSTNANAVSDALRNLGQSFNNVIGRNTQQGLNNAGQNINNVGNNAGRAATQMQEFGRQSALAVRRFAAFTVVTSSIYAFTGALRQGISDFIAFDKEFVRLQQVTGESAKGLQGLSDQITKLATSLGVSSSELTTVAVTLAQAGLSAADTRRALEALAKSSLAPSFDDMNQTVEGSIALMRQFGIGAGDLESALGSVNAVAAQFAVEASDLIVAIQRTGGVFATASKGVSEGTDALNEFLAIFTSVRATTRESAETIATGLRTIFTRIQRAETIQALERFGVTLTDLEGKFVGPYEAVKRLSEGLSRLDPRDLQFSQIVEELGGFRQIGKVIPLIQQFAVAQQALKTAQTGQASLSKDAATAQLSIANQIAKVREEFTALVRSIGESDSFRSFVSLSLQLASALIKLADAAKIVLPALTALATIRGLSALIEFGTGFAGAFGAAGGARGLGQRLGGGRRFASGGLVPGSGNRDTVSAMLTPGEFVIRKKAVSAIGVNNLHKMNRYAGGGTAKKKSAQKPTNLPESGPTEFTHISLSSPVIPKKLQQWAKSNNIGQISRLYTNMGLDLPKTWNRNWAIHKKDNYGAYSDIVSNYIKKKDVFKTLKQSNRIYRFTGRSKSPEAAILGDNHEEIRSVLSKKITKNKFFDTDPDVDAILPGSLKKSIEQVLDQDAIKAQTLIKGFEQVSAYKVEGQPDRKKITTSMRSMLKNSGGFIKRFATGGLAKAPLVDDILQASGSILPKPSDAIQALINAGGGAVDVDRTLKRTLGDKAYSSAKSGDAKNQVLSRYFRNDQQRLEDIQSSPLTAFGKELLESIKSKKLDPKTLSIISKSRRTRGVPEYLSQLFGIPVQNMVFTQGGDKQPAMDAIRSKGPRANRVSRFALGGLVQRFAQKGTGSYRSGTVKPLTPEEQSELSGLLSLEKRWQDSGQKLRAFTSDKQSRLSQLKSRKALGGAQSDEIINGIKLSKTFGVSFLEGGVPDISATISDVLARGNATGVDKLRAFIGNKQKARGARITTDGKSSTLSPGGKDIFDRQIMNGLPDLFDNAVAVLPEPLRPGRGQVSTDQLISSSAKQAIKGYFFEAFIRRASQNLLSDNDTTDAIFDFTGAGNKEVLGPLFGGRFVTPNEFKVSPTPENIANAISKAIAISSPSALQYFNSGGSVEDTVPALLTPGEFVINKKAAQRIGSSRLHQLNRADKVQGFNKGGMVDGLQTFANGGGVQKFFVGGVVAGLTRLGPVLVKAFTALSSTVTKLGTNITGVTRNLTTASRNVQQTGLIPSGSAGRNLMRQARAARAEGLSGQAFRNRMGGRGGMGGLGGFVALTAGGAAIEGASSLRGGESTTSGRMISNMGGDALNYGSIGATIGSFFGPWGTAIGGAAGALVGLTTGFFKAQKAAEEFAEKTRQAKIEKSSESISTQLDQFLKNPEANTQDLNVGMAEIFTELKTLAAQEAEKNLSKESLRTKTATEIVTTQKAGSESATRILEAAMGKTGKTLDEVSASIDPKTFRILTQQIAQVSPEYIAKWQELANETDPERQKALNAELDDIRMKYSRVALAAKENETIEKRRADEAAKIVKEIDKTLDIYRRANAYADKYAASLERLIKATDARTNDFSNAPKVQDIDRKNEEVLGNLSAFSFKEVRAAAGGVAGLAGGSPEAKALADQAVASKILADQLPALVKSTDITNRNQIKDNLTGLFQAQGINIETPEIAKVLNDVGNRLEKSASDTDVDKLTKELEDTVISELSKTAQEGSQLLQKLAKTYNDTLQESINLQNQYNEAMGRSNEYMRKAGVIRLNAELDLAKALGNSPTLQQLNEPFEFEIKDLTRGLRDVGGLTANQAMDPAAIGLAMMRTSKENARLEAENAANLEKASGLGADEAGNRQRAELAAANLNNVAALGKNKLALDEGRQALEKLANDGTKAANALAKIQEEQQKVEGFGNFLQKIATADFDQLFQMNRESSALAAARESGPEFMRNVENRQLAFAGLEAQRELYSPQEFANIRADLLTKFYESQGFQGQDFVPKLGMTLEKAMERIRGRVSEEDPNVIAYREAVNEQIKANEILGLLNKQQALIIQESMIDLQVFLAKDFPNILTQALRDAVTDANAANPKNLPVAVPAPGVAAPPAVAAPAGAAPKPVAGAGPAPLNVREQQALRDFAAKEEQRLAELEAKDKAGTLQDNEQGELKDLRRGRAFAEAFNNTLPAPPAPGTGGVLDRLNAERAQLEAQRLSIQKQTEEKMINTQEAQKPNRAIQGVTAQAVVQANAQAAQAVNTKQTFVEGENYITRAEKQYAPTAERKAFVQQELIAARKRQRLGQKLPTDDSVISASSFELQNIAQAEKAQKRKDYLLSQNPLTRKRLFTQAERESGLADELANAPQVKSESKPLTQYQQSKLSRRQAAASRYRPEVARRMFSDLYKISENTPTTSVTQTPSGTPQVVPSTVAPPQTGNQVIPTTGGPTGGNGFQIQLDPNAQAFLDSLSSTFSTFNTYIDKLSAVAATIPPKIELTGSYVLDVQISGAAAFEALEKRMKELAVSLVEPKLAALRDEVSAITGGQVKSSASMGSPSSGATSSQGE